MAREPIRAFSGWIIGWNDEDGSGNRIIRNFSGQILGKYVASENKTRDFSGRIIGSGDQRMGLLYEDIYKRGEPAELQAIKH